jgi:hypothetical protein
MDDAAQGFRIGADFFRWGTLFDDVAPGAVDTGYASTNLRCVSTYGFATVSAAVTAPRPDRPVTGLAYELAAAGMAPKEVFAQLVIRLGAPTEIDREDENDGDSNSVVLYAQWSRDGIGILYLNWNDDAASAPFMDAWRTASDALALTATSAATVHVFHVAYEINPLPEPRCLHHPEILATPADVAARLGTTGFALWSDANGLCWHLSTAADSIVLGGPAASTVQVMEIEPAKGGGFAAIDVGAWSVRDAWGSRAIAEAARLLANLPGLTITRHEGYDV